jgi:hypothetical protein
MDPLVGGTEAVALWAAGTPSSLVGLNLRPSAVSAVCVALIIPSG